MTSLKQEDSKQETKTGDTPKSATKAEPDSKSWGECLKCKNSCKTSTSICETCEHFGWVPGKIVKDIAVMSWPDEQRAEVSKFTVPIPDVKEWKQEFARRLENEPAIAAAWRSSHGHQGQWPYDTYQTMAALGYNSKNLPTEQEYRRIYKLLYACILYGTSPTFTSVFAKDHEQIKKIMDDRYSRFYPVVRVVYPRLGYTNYTADKVHPMSYYLVGLGYTEYDVYKMSAEDLKKWFDKTEMARKKLDVCCFCLGIKDSYRGN